MQSPVLRAIIRLAVVVALIWPGGRALAMDVHCIEASKYKYIWMLFDDDKTKFAEFVQVEQDRLPEPDMCRAVVLTGVVGGCKSGTVDEQLVHRELAELIAIIEKNQGWLAEIYLSSPGGDHHSAMLLGELVRTSWLKTKAFDNGAAVYSPDIDYAFLSPAAKLTYERRHKG